MKFLFNGLATFTRACVSSFAMQDVVVITYCPQTRERNVVYKFIYFSVQTVLSCDWGNPASMFVSYSQENLYYKKHEKADDKFWLVRCREAGAKCQYVGLQKSRNDKPPVNISTRSQMGACS